MRHLFKPLIYSMLVVFFSSCNKNEIVQPSIPKSVTVTDYSSSIFENPRNGTTIGFLSVSAVGGTLNYTLIEGDGIAIDSSNGRLTVADSTFFDYELNTSISGAAIVGLDNDPETEKRVEITIEIIDVDESPALNVQQRLNAGETPFEIYQSDFTLLDSLYGMNYEGGLIFYLNTSDGSGLLAAESDQSSGIAWDTTTNASNQIVTGASASAIGAGVSNTNAIVIALAGLGMNAATICDDLTLNSKSDWFLPSANEMNEMFNNLQANGMGNFAGERYWTSTEWDMSTGAAFYRNFDVSASQITGTTPKVALYHVRAARAF